jgi:hypothetical protein
MVRLDDGTEVPVRVTVGRLDQGHGEDHLWVEAWHQRPDGSYRYICAGKQSGTFVTEQHGT